MDILCSPYKIPQILLKFDMGYFTDIRQTTCHEG